MERGGCKQSSGRLAGTPSAFAWLVSSIWICSYSDSDMKPITALAVVVTILFVSSGCDKKTSDDLKWQAQDAQTKIETKAKEAKDAAAPKLKELNEKAREAAKDAEPKLKEMGDKAKDATQNAIEKTKQAADSAVQQLKDAARASPAAASPSATP